MCAPCRPPRKRQKRDDPEPVAGDGQDAQMSDAERALMTAPTLELGDTAPDDLEDGLQRGASKVCHSSFFSDTSADALIAKATGRVGQTVNIPDVALIIKIEWCNKILFANKTWELRSRQILVSKEFWIDQYPTQDSVGV